MLHLDVDPNIVIPWEHRNTEASLVRLAFDGDLEKSREGRALAFSTGKADWKWKYIIFDGHYRREAAIIAKSKLPISVIERPKDFKFTDAYNEREFTEMSFREFQEYKEQLINDAYVLLTGKIRSIHFWDAEEVFEDLEYNYSF